MLFGAWFAVAVLSAVEVRAHLFTSHHNMLALAHLEHQLINAMHDYMRSQQEKLELLRKRLEEIKKLRLDLTSEKFLGDPVSAFALIKRLSRQWPLLLNIMIEKYDIPEDLLNLPTEEDVQNAVSGLARLQQVYNLDSEQLAEGTWGSLGMTASDCYEMGKYFYKAVEFELANSWFDQTMQMIEKGDSTVGRDQVIAHMFLSWTFNGCKYSNQTSATNGLLQYLISYYPSFAVNQDLSTDFRHALARNCSWVESAKEYQVNVDAMAQEDSLAYNENCRGQGRVEGHLKCHYVHHNNPRLLIAPIKLEEIFLDPPLIMYHDVISDEEIEEMKTAFYGVRTECETLYDGKVPTNSQYRKCNVGWVSDSMTPASARLTRRIGDFANMDMKTSEFNQVANYGLGGEFMLHQDPIMDTALSASNHHGDRIATFMVYLNDVESGGFTVFPKLGAGLAVTPRKGSAVFWYNLDSQSEKIESMLHGGCPVLRGTKWVLNKWIHEGGQDFEMTCPKDGRFPKNLSVLK